jgi:hypothetical protein
MSLSPDAPERRTHWATFVYYYIGAFVGLLVMTISLIIVVVAIVGGDGDAVLGGLLSAAVGVPVFWWHLDQARRRERR